MNKDRRNRLEAIKSKLEELNGEIECLCDEEREALDNLPDSLREAKRGQNMDNNVNDLDSACDDITEAIGCIESAVQR